MSSAEQSSVNSDTIEQTKQQIRGLVGEIVQLSKSDLGPEQYYPAVLQRIVQALAAVGGAVWVSDEGRGLKLVYQINLSDTLMDVQSEDGMRHHRLVEYIKGSNQPQLIPPLSGLSDERAGGNPTRYLLVMAPMQSDATAEGVIEIFQRPDSQPATQRGYLKFLVQMCEQISEWLKSRKLRHYSDRHSLWAQADHFSRLVHSTLDLSETAYTIVNEGRRLIGCDRVSLALLRGSKCTVTAISGQDTLDNRSNIVTTLGNLASKVVGTGEPLYYDGTTADMPPQLEDAVHAYVDESYAKTVTVMPIRKPGDPEVIDKDREDVGRDIREDREVIGALIVEQIESDVPREVLIPKTDLVYEHAARALSNSLEHNDLFLMPVWKTLGKASWVMRTRTLPKTLTISGIVLVLLISMFVVPYKFTLSAKGALQPVYQQEIFVNTPGRIEHLYVRDGQNVKKDEILAELTSEDLNLDLNKVLGEIKETTEQLSTVERARLGTGLTRADATKYSGEAARLRLHLESLNAQQDLILSKKDQLKIRSPMDGTVVLSWDVEKQLLHRPVERGRSLMSIADTTREWELELFMPERRIGHIKNRQTKLGKTDLEVSYVLATDPSRVRYGKVRDIHDTTQMHEQEGHVVRVRVDLEQKEVPPNPRPGSSATASVYCGYVPIGYAWFHEAIEYAQKFWFQYF